MFLVKISDICEYRHNPYETVDLDKCKINKNHIGYSYLVYGFRTFWINKKYESIALRLSEFKIRLDMEGKHVRS